MPAPEFTDRDAEELLRLIHRYYHDTDNLQGGVVDMMVSELVADLAMSMWETTNTADRYRREIEETLSL